jgi:hypothetical protein
LLTASTKVLASTARGGYSTNLPVLRCYMVLEKGDQGY